MPAPAALSTPLAWALKYAEIGWHVLPLEPRAKQPLGKLAPRGLHDATVDQDVIRRWWAACPTANIGIALAQSGLVAVDVDPRNGGSDTFDALQVAHGSLRSEVMAFTGGGGEHHVFQLPHGAQVSLPGTLGPGVDLKCNGYIVVEPSVHPSGNAYGWEASSNPLDGVVPSPLPDWLRSLRVRVEAPAPTPGSVAVDARQSRDAREALYTLDADDYQQWVQAGMALHSTGWGQAAFAMWCAWAQQSQKFDAADSRRKWESFKAPDARGGGLSLAWIFGEAQRRGWQNPAKRLRLADAANAEPPEWVDDVPPEYPQEPLEALDLGPRLGAAAVMTVSDLDAKAGSLTWAVKHLVPERGMGFIFGASGTFKSFIALDYALHRCYGMKWLGRKTKQAVPVYLAAEGGAGLIRRIKAWHMHRGMIWQDCPMRVVVVPLTLRTQASALRLAIEETGVQPGDLIVDTMSQTFTGNENSNDEVADFLRALGTELRDGLGCTVIVVHHTGHMATERPRGASAIIANIDFAFGVFRDEKEMLATMEFAKVKDEERGQPVSFELRRVEIGHDEDGDAITSLSASQISDATGLSEAMKREALQGRGGRNRLFLRLAQNGMPERELRKVFGDEVDLTDPDARRKAYYRAREWAIEAGFVEVAEGRIIVLKEWE
jgi:hypothetical protein